MQTLINNKTSGFICQGGQLLITKYGKPFYVVNKQTPFAFNLPKGVYECNLEVKKLDKPVVYSTPSLPSRERTVKLPKNFKVLLIDNPNKCSVVMELGLILLDKSLKESPEPFIVYILFHELGHFFYKSEDKCDRFAEYQMLKRGYNPSQCKYANNITLRCEDRKKLSNNFLFKVKVK